MVTYYGYFSHISKHMKIYLLVKRLYFEAYIEAYFEAYWYSFIRSPFESKQQLKSTKVLNMYSAQ